ncbi:irregular chiasm C-roughest protein-like isoform X2 [Limulus polyphemus]|uniref:Irregular chiasm C-roughest protein-like isoform X2 n=1 Tax=Limulus polyphemus TaxID=6850 RepID=A0ABM1S5T3_LIMPO|nr:irregular chiasm C-roughest protein-like isoform X2 [Limulus polyphemus]
MKRRDKEQCPSTEGEMKPNRQNLFSQQLRSPLCLVHLSFMVLAQVMQSLGSPLGVIQQTFAIQPADRTAIKGDKIVLPCRVLHKKGTLQWTRDGFGLGSERSLAGFPRYTMVGSDEEGDFSLQITNVSLEDDAVFQCQVGASDGVKGIRSRSAVFTVYVPPEPPRILQRDFLETTSGMAVELTCESNGGKPAAELAWLDGEGNVVTENIEFNTKLLGDNKRANAALKWTFKPRREHDGKSFSCRSENPALKQPRVAIIKLAVKYPPEVTLTANRKKITEFDDVQFTCDAVANPGDVKYKWYRNDELIKDDHVTTLTIRKVTRQLNGQTVSCEVSNKIGTTKSTYTLNIYYGPVFKSSLENIAADPDKEVRLVCAVDGNPPPKITWTFEKSSQIIGTDRILILPRVTPDKTGRYTCKASVPGFPELSSDSLVFIKGPPLIKSPAVQYGIEGQQVKVECSITSVPEPSRVVWIKQSQVVDIDNSEGYEIVTEPLLDGLRNVLIIHKAEENDFGDYNCSAWNSLGHDSMLISVKRQKSLPMLIILAGVIGGIVLIVSVTIVIILCLRRKPTPKGNEFGTDNKAKQSDSASSGDSDLKVEIRTASSLSNNEHERSWEETSDTTRVHDPPDIYKYNMDYTEPRFPPKLETQNNNGYIPYVDYSRDYNPPSAHLNSSRDSGLYDSSPQLLNDLGHPLDPNFRAAYANPYRRTSQANLPPDQGLYGSTRGNSPTPQVPSLPSNHYITSQNLPCHLKPGTLATHV